MGSYGAPSGVRTELCHVLPAVPDYRPDPAELRRIAASCAWHSVEAAELLGLSTEADSPLRVLIYPDREALGRRSPHDDRSFYDGRGAIHTVLEEGTVTNLAHEVAHHHVDRVNRRTPRWIDEGFAEAFGRGYVTGGSPYPVVDAERCTCSSDLLAAIVDADERVDLDGNYWLVGSFVAFLAQEIGLPEFRRLMALDDAGVRRRLDGWVARWARTTAARNDNADGLPPRCPCSDPSESADEDVTTTSRIEQLRRRVQQLAEAEDWPGLAALGQGHLRDEEDRDVRVVAAMALRRAHAESGRFSRALEVIEQIDRELQSADARVRQIVIYENLRAGRRTRARSVLQDASCVFTEAHERLLGRMIRSPVADRIPVAADLRNRRRHFESVWGLAEEDRGLVPWVWTSYSGLSTADRTRYVSEMQDALEQYDPEFASMWQRAVVEWGAAAIAGDTGGADVVGALRDFSERCSDPETRGALTKLARRLETIGSMVRCRTRNPAAVEGSGDNE